MKESGIYEIVNIDTGKKYIGSSVDLKRRLHEHEYRLKNGKHRNEHLQNAWNKYGADSFKFNVLEVCDKDIIRIREKEYFQKHNWDDLYNIDPNPELNGITITDEVRQKLSEANKGKNSPFYGKKHSDETIHKMSEAKKGKKHSEETIRKLSEAAKVL